MKLKGLLASVLLAAAVAFPAFGFDFTDDLGAKASWQASPTKVAPSGKIAQQMMLVFDKTKLVGLSGKLSDKVAKFFDLDTSKMVEFGQFYGGKASFNPEVVLNAGADLILDMGEAKKTIKEDLAGLTQKSGIPALFIKATLTDMDSAFRRMGELFQNKERGEELARYAEELYAYAAERKEAMAKAPSVYFALGDEGLSTNARGSFHAQVLDLVGATNAADVEFSSKGAGTQVSMEQLINWQPGWVITESKEVYDLVTSDGAWKALDAVKEGRVALIPSTPYNVVLNPPSSNRLIGIYWLGNLIAPEIYNFDMTEKMAQFFKLFYGADLPKEEVEKILGK